MLVELRLENFRCFEDHTIPFRPVTVMVGANNAGKSTIIEALRLLSLVLTRYGAINFTEAPDWLRAACSQRGIKPYLKYIEWNYESVFHNLGEPPAVITAKFKTGALAKIYIGTGGAIHAVVLDDEGRPVTTKNRASVAPLPRISAMPQVAPVAHKEVVLDSQYVERITSSSWESLHFRNQIKLFPQHFKRFKELAQSTWPGLRIKSFIGQRGLPKDPLGLLVQDGTFVAELAWVGQGLQMWLQTMWFLVQSANSTGIILDEPDVYMHADLQRQLIRLLRGKYRQLIVATHSVEIMAEVDASEVLIINRRARQSDFASSLPGVQKVIDRLGGVHNLELARLSTSGRCLLVEGDDLPMLKEIASTAMPGRSQSLDVIPYMPINGWGGWNYAVGSKMLLKNAMGQRVIVYCILDSDYHTPEAITERYQDAAEKGVELHIWKRKELENYLIVPEAIQRLITKGIRRGTAPSADEINGAIESILGGLRDDISDAMTEEFIKQDRSDLKAAFVRTRHRLDEAWATSERRLSTASGKEVISRLSEWSQGNYGVSISVMKLVRELQRHEIDHELAGVIRALQSGATFGAVGLRTGA